MPRPALPARVPALVLVPALALLVSGCATVVRGQARPLAPAVADVGAGEVPIVGAGAGRIDELARNALSDLEAFWAQRLPEVYGQDFPPLEGGYFSVDPGTVGPADFPDGVSCGSDPLDVEGNAFYCDSPGEPHSDSISYDRSFLAELSQQFGRFIPDLVMAHEFGHAVQARVGFPQASIVAETQADCFAGAWTDWVAAGEAEHTTIRPPELDELLRGYLQLRDPVGTSFGEQAAHGSFFDRVSAFQEGFAGGAEACRDDFGRDRVFTQQQFETDVDIARGGNAPYGETLDVVNASLPAYWQSVFTDVLGRTFDPPSIQPFQGSAPACATEDRDLVYCPDQNLVGFDETDLIRQRAYALGDFAVATAVAVPYALAARHELGLSTGGSAALRSAVCLTGAYGFAVFAGTVPDVTISPGDIDESVTFLLTFGTDPQVFPAVGLTGFELVDVFRTGFVRGVSSCGLTP